MYVNYIHNIGLNEENSLSHLLEKISPEIENETDLIEHSKYYNDVDFKNLLHNAKSKISMLSLNCQSINAKFDKLKLFLDDVSIEHPISVICIQESWGHEEMEMSYFSLPNYSMVFENRRLSTHGGLILYVLGPERFTDLTIRFDSIIILAIRFDFIRFDSISFDSIRLYLSLIFRNN